MTIRHDAFISYSHGNDAALAAALEAGLERLARPTFSLRAMDVFRDKSSLAAAPGLWSGIHEHLAGSKWFLLMASPAAAASNWCKKEIAWWLENRAVATMLIVLTEGEIVWDAHAGDFDWSRTTALSTALRGRFAEEPLYVDCRWAHGEKRLVLSDGRFRDVVLDLAATIRAVPKDLLDGEDVRQLRRTKLIARAGVTMIVIVAALAVWQAIEATMQRRVAEQQRDAALSRQLAAQANELRVQQPRLSLLLAVQAVASTRTAEAYTSLLRAMNAAPFERVIEQTESFWSLAVSDDEKWGAIGGGHGTTLRVSLVTGDVERLTGADSDPLKATLAVALSPDGSSVASGGFDQVITIWTNGTVVRKIAGRHEGFILGLAYSPDGRLLASAGSDGRIFIHDLASGMALKLKDGWTPEASAVRFSPDGSIVAAGGDKGFRALYHSTDGGLLLPKRRPQLTADQPPAPSSSVVALCFTRDGSELFVGFLDGVVDIYDVPSARIKARVTVRNHSELQALAVAPDGSRVFTGHGDGSVILSHRPQTTYSTWTNEILYRHATEVRGVVFLPHTNQLATIGFDGRLFLGRPSFLPPLTRKRWESAQPFVTASLIAGENRVRLSMKDQSVVVDAQSGSVLSVDELGLSRPEARATLWAIASSAEQEAFTDANGRLILKQHQQGNQVEVPAIGEKPIAAGSFSPDGRTVYALHGDEELRAWDTRTGALRGQARIGQTFLPRMAVSGDGELLAVALGVGIDFGASGRRGRSERVILIRARDLRILTDNLESLPEGSPTSSEALFFTPDSRMLALKSGSVPHLTLWDLSTLQRLDEAVVIPPHVQILGFTGSSNQLLLGMTASGQSALLEVDLAPDAWANEACRVAGSTLTREEWRTYVSRDLQYNPACIDQKFHVGSAAQ